MFTEIITAVVVGLWVMLPAYLPNSFAAVFGGGTPIDGGKTMKDGRRILGDGKTWRGFFAGILLGFLTGCAEIWLVSRGFHFFGIQLPGFSSSGVSGAFDLSAVIAILSLAVGALLGDMIFSFLKRRLGLQRGQSLPLVDQYDFLAGAFLLTALTSYGWLVGTLDWLTFIIIIIITPILHVGTNIVGYWLGIKNEPW
ncbi:CDP-2,3-bis-(O-geranylgeranyl)-sn-glycerol synthase [Methanimicrococcus blatticola]|uniref:CDP-archaeol synthase n=1 Tax=Methanimicrococcus blatticola TaxID=91560 RepID=A0A484F897_9EURY|nr:CDP-2,3-bis-(O-geranylgeranyl)-sn-glycerol synthase [Methanimicrococcus blatticola]MBZ3935230.1 CDP-2,3-bis-(O-geranylgeranyl)-sn-glycerol synthase [Methanimicrococcus blatticola]MCC2508672.1 CDP-2,3-bis-(O-geranylgeranyl)-sn-glycerol synthase [Methanimicrococcus blatticola]TDQ71291.1 CDP-2,3-bis-(O-geranylgeranyl)-sn-glycerol synthase [Methanimicrococcus blatticola]